MVKKITLVCLISFLLVFTSCSPDVFSKVEDVTVLSAIPNLKFAENGIVSVSIIPTDKKGKAIISDSISVKANSILNNVITELEVSTPVPNKPDKNTLPWAFAIDIDASGSMSSTDPNKIRIEASKLFVNSILSESNRTLFAVATFGDGSSQNFDKTKLLQDFTSDKQLLYTAIDSVPARGGTPLWDSAYEFAEYLSNTISSSQYMKEMLILSDGGDNGSRSYDSNDVKQYASAQGIPVHTVALGYNSNELQDIALATGGVYIHSTDADNLKDAFTNLSSANINGYIVYSLTYPSGSIPRRGSIVTLQLAVKNALSGEKVVTTEFKVE